MTTNIAWSTPTLEDLEARLARRVDQFMDDPADRGKAQNGSYDRAYAQWLEKKAEYICRTHAEQPEAEGLLTSVLALHGANVAALSQEGCD